MGHEKESEPIRGCLIIIMIVLLIAGCGGTQLPKGNTQVNQSYRLGPHDVLTLAVYGDPDMTKSELLVDDQGDIDVPLLGDLNVRGKTVEEVEEDIRTRLQAGYLKDPKVHLSMVRYRNYYVHGQANTPGAYSYQSGLTVLKAITHAGGFTETAAEGRTKVIRMVNGKEERFSADMDALIQPDDIILIPESYF